MVITNSGMFVSKVTSFGLRNAPKRFQQFMDSIMFSCKAFTIIYLDDTIIFSDSEDRHIANLNMFLKTLSKNGLLLNKTKCFFS